MSSRWVDFKDVKARVSIRQVLEHFTIPFDEAKDGQLTLACPIHGGDNTRAFHVDLHKNVWRCFTGCQRGGNVLDLMMELEGLSIRDAALKLQELFMGQEPKERSRPPAGPSRRGIPASRVSSAAPRPEIAQKPSKPSEKAAGAVLRRYRPLRVRAAANDPLKRPEPHRTLVDNEGEEAPTKGRGQSMQPREGSTARAAPSPAPSPQRAGAHDLEPNPVLSLSLPLRAQHPYLEGRGIGPEAIAHFGLGYCPRGILAGRIAIPIHNTTGQLVAFAGRHPKGHAPKYKFPAGFRKSVELYNLHRAAAHARKHGLVLVEGFFDAINLWQLGVPNAVALMGTELSATQEELLVQHTDRVVLMLDGDEAGRAATAMLLPRLSARIFVKVVQLPEGVQPDGLEHIESLVGQLPT